MAHSNAERQCHAPHIFVMLLGEDLRGRHDAGLVTVLHRHKRGDHGDDGLAASHVALHQPVHGTAPRSCHVLISAITRSWAAVRLKGSFS